MSNLSIEKLHKIVDDAPNIDPLTGLIKCRWYTSNDKVFYFSSSSVYDIYSFSEYDADNENFYHWRYDVNNDSIKEYEYICSLFDAIYTKGFYENNQKYWHIPDDIIKQTLKDYCEDNISDETGELYSKINDIKKQIKSTKQKVIDTMNKNLPDAYKFTL